MRLIDADALKDVLENMRERHRKNLFIVSANAYDGAIRIVGAMKTIEARPVVMGQWSVRQDEYLELYTIRCSVCHGEWCFEEEGDIVAMCYNYCPKCGNPMLVVKKEVQDEVVSEA